MPDNKITIGVKFSGLKTDKFKNLKIDASGLSNKEREKLPVEVNESVFFSSKISDAKLLAKMHDYILRAARGESGYHRDDFSKKIRAYFGLKPWEGGTKMSDITSTARLDLIFEHNLAKMAGRSQYLSSLRTLRVAPAQEFERYQTRKRPRDWIKRWKEAGGKLHNGRMIAPILDPIWIKLSRFGLPYAPFDYNSGMNVTSISAREAVRLGIMTEKQIMEQAERGRFFRGVGEPPDPSDGFIDITGGGFDDDGGGNLGMSASLPKEEKLAEPQKPKKESVIPATEKPQEEASVSLDDIPYTLDTTSPEKVISVSLKQIAQPHDELPEMQVSEPQKTGFTQKLIDGLMASFLAFFGAPKVVKSRKGDEVVFTGDAGNLAASAHDYAGGNAFRIIGFTPQISNSPLINPGSVAELAFRQFDDFIFSEMPKNEAQLSAMVLKAPSRISYDRNSRRFLISKRCGERSYYVVARPGKNKTLIVSYIGERNAAHVYG